MKSDVLVVVTLAFAFVLFLIPLPGWAVLARPELPLLVYLYWVMSMPQRYGVVLAGILGLVQGAYTGAHLGVHVLIYCLATGVFLLSYQQIRMQNLWWQALTLIPFLLANQWLKLFFSTANWQGWHYWFAFLLPVLSSVLVWPWLVVFLRGLRRRFHLVNRL